MRRGAAYIDELIAQGEHVTQDFKYQITDARKIARSVAAFANHAGGRLLVGVKDNGTVAGVSGDEEVYMIEEAAQVYCRPAQHVDFVTHNVRGRVVVEAIIGIAANGPVMAPDEHGNYVAYYRVADENVVASRVHERVMALREPVTITIGAPERRLLDYLSTHGAVTLNGVARLAHVSRAAADEMVVALCEMGVVALDYHDGDCVVRSV